MSEAENAKLEKPPGAEKAVRKEVEEKIIGKREPQWPLFGTFSGVFTPTLFTILGVIMYLRQGWVVGNAGLLGAFAIILLSFTITSFTALSLASITTNIRIGAGGAFSIISQSLGLEVGGSIGIPLFLSQALAVAMYIFGFRAGWLYIFPGHPPLLVVLSLHAYLVKKHLRAPYGDVRSGLFAAMAEWAAKKMENLAGPFEKTWKANLLVPVEISSHAASIYALLRDISYPKGFVRLLGLTGKTKEDELAENLPALANRFLEDGGFATWTVVRSSTFSENVAAGLEALGGAFFQSNLIFIRLAQEIERREEIRRIIRSAGQSRLGVLLYANPEEIPHKERGIHMILEEPEEGWKIGTDLALLISYKLKQNWKSDLVLIAELKNGQVGEQALDYLKSVAELARIPNTELPGLLPGQRGGADRKTFRDGIQYELGSECKANLCKPELRRPYCSFPEGFRFDLAYWQRSRSAHLDHNNLKSNLLFCYSQNIWFQDLNRIMEFLWIRG